MEKSSSNTDIVQVEEEEDDVCPVCLCQMSKPYERLGCGHRIHSQCMVQLLLHRYDHCVLCDHPVFEEGPRNIRMVTFPRRPMTEAAVRQLIGRIICILSVLGLLILVLIISANLSTKHQFVSPEILVLMWVGLMLSIAIFKMLSIAIRYLRYAD